MTAEEDDECFEEQMDDIRVRPAVLKPVRGEFSSLAFLPQFKLGMEASLASPCEAERTCAEHMYQ